MARVEHLITFKRVKVDEMIILLGHKSWIEVFYKNRTFSYKGDLTFPYITFIIVNMTFFNIRGSAIFRHIIICLFTVIYRWI